jgi:hypothetical protein
LQRNYYGGGDILATGTDQAYAAGITAYSYNFTVTKNAVISSSITAAGTASGKNARHIYAYKRGTVSASNNYYSGTITVTPAPGTANAAMDGVSDALSSLTDFTNTATLGWNPSGYVVWEWDAAKGRPVLINNNEEP